MWDLKIIDTDKPIYLALVEAMERDILSGLLRPGEKMPTHRELAKKVGVTVTTITRAYKEAERRGMITAIVGNGTFVTADLGIHSSLINIESRDNKLIEMGLVFPLYFVERGLDDLLKNILRKSNLGLLMKYTPPQGLPYHRKTGSAWVKRFGIETTPDNVVVTAGAQHAINCIFTSLFQPSDYIAVDCLTYPGIKAVARQHNIHLDGIPMDEQGMLPHELENACKRHNIKAVYTVANMQNPTNSIMSEKRKNQMCKVIRDNGLLLLEDDLYGFLQTPTLPALSSIIPEQSIYIAGISKAFFAGLRTGFLIAPKQYINKISQAVLDTIWMTSPLCAEIACEAINSGVADHVISQKRAEIDRRMQLFYSKFRQYEFAYAEHSMFVWFKLPEPWTYSAFENRAKLKGVNIIASNSFAVGNTLSPNYIRISLTAAESNFEYEDGLTKLCDVLTNTEKTANGIL